MKNSNEYLIPFVGLKIGKHRYDFQIRKKFFEEFNFDEFDYCNVTVKVVLEKKETMLEIYFKHEGVVNVPCDVSGDNFDMTVSGKLRLIVQFGEEFNNDNEELLILPHGEYQIVIKQYVYEMIALSIPQKRINKSSKKTFKTEEIEKKDTLLEEKLNKEIDPRWEKLKQLLTDK